MEQPGCQGVSWHSKEDKNCHLHKVGPFDTLKNDSGSEALLLCKHCGSWKHFTNLPGPNIKTIRERDIVWCVYSHCARVLLHKVLTSPYKKACDMQVPQGMHERQGVQCCDLASQYKEVYFEEVAGWLQGIQEGSRILFFCVLRWYAPLRCLHWLLIMDIRLLAILIITATFMVQELAIVIMVSLWTAASASQTVVQTVRSAVPETSARMA